jgi:nickel/cobalt transporter (NicO) family protein
MCSKGMAYDNIRKIIHNSNDNKLAYASSVAAALMGITVLSVKLFGRIQHRILPYLKYLPKISALVLAVMALLFALGLF